MPITIGPITNVPVPGDPIDSDWAQDVSQHSVDTKTYAVNVNTTVTNNKATTDAAWVVTPRGVLKRVSVTAPQTVSSASTTDLTGLTAAITVASGAGATRWVLTHFAVHLRRGDSIGLVQIGIHDQANTLLAAYTVNLATAGTYPTTIAGVHAEALAPGNYTRKLRLFNAGQAGDITVQNAATTPGELVIVDAGKAS